MPALADTMTLKLASRLAHSIANPAPEKDASMNFTHQPNETVLDRYTIRNAVGMGGFGEVYFAVSQAGKEVALKRIQRNLSVELRGVSHCLNLKHPHLVSLHDICRDDHDQAWVVMEYVAGDNLRQILDRQQTARGYDLLPMAETKRWFTGMAAGVNHLHEAGVVHRDLKPGNLFDDNGIIKVGDYGLSKFISSSHRGGHTESIGTFHYMAPEVGRGNYGREIDIYAMGIILYELLTQRLPFDGETPQEILIKHLSQEPDFSPVPTEFRAVIKACLAKDPSKRPHNVAAMMALTPWASEFDQSNLWATGQDRATSRVIPDAAKPRNANAADDPILDAIPVSARPGVVKPPTVKLSHPSAEEPVAKAVRTSVQDLSAWWRGLERSPGSKVFIVFATALILLINTHWLLPLLSLVAFCYVPYYVIRHIVLQISDPDTYVSPAAKPQPTQLAAVASPPEPKPKPRKLGRHEIQPMLRRGLADRSKTTLAAEWATSGMTSMVFGLALLLIGSVIGLRNADLTATNLAPYVWMATVVWIGSASLLAVGKAWESSEGEGLVRRLICASVGAVVGVIAYLIADFLMIPLDSGLGRDIDATSLPVSFYDQSGLPKAAAMMAHFAALFGLLRMWKPVDPLRRTRLSLWAVTVAVVGEWLVHQLVPVPQPSGMLIAGGIVVMTQMSAPWVKSDSIAALAPGEVA